MDAAANSWTAAAVTAPTVTPTEGGSLYDFAQAGDTLAMHHHAPGTEHDLRVIEGSVEVYSPPGEGAWTRTYRAGDYIKLPHGWHEIKALTDNTRTLHRPWS